MEELQNAKKQISEGKAPRDDGIKPEIDDIRNKTNSPSLT